MIAFGWEKQGRLVNFVCFFSLQESHGIMHYEIGQPKGYMIKVVTKPNQTYYRKKQLNLVRHRLS